MRVTQNMEQAQFLTALNQLESSISTTQNGISTGLAFTTASQNPVGAGLVAGYNQVLAQSQQYTSNGQSATGSLNTEDSALTQLQSQLQSLRDLALEANNATESPSDLSAIATQVQQIQGSILSLANTQDGEGNYIFAGYSTQTQPFAQTATGATYSGDQGQRQVQIGAGQTVVVGDNGDLVFNQVKNGNGTFNVTAASTNTGSGIIGATAVTDPADYVAGAYSINFTAPDAYQVVNSGGTVVTSGTYTSGQAITFAGMQVTLSGSAGRRRLVRRRAEHGPERLHHRAESRQCLAAKHGDSGGTGAAQQFHRERHQRHRPGARSTPKPCRRASAAG